MIQFTCEAVDLMWIFSLHGNPRFGLNPRVFGRADLRISLSRAKFDEEADFEVRSAVAPQKPHQISEKRKFGSKKFSEHNFFGVEK